MVGVGQRARVVPAEGEKEEAAFQRRAGRNERKKEPRRKREEKKRESRGKVAFSV